ncbi:hypothetical protein BGW39_011466 [Mortierella sp. 14UC]|nr:hypothetical protein BGW39_011466 [Mortierella sp. 14UC]
MPGITNLPDEVLALIDDRLDNKALLASLLTCRILQQSLSHRLWRTVRLKGGGPQVNLNDLATHAHVVSRYEIHGVSLFSVLGGQFTSFRCPRSLDVNGIWGNEGYRLDWFWRACARFEEINFTEFWGDTPSNLSEQSFESVKRVSWDWKVLFERPCIIYCEQLDIIRKFSNLTKLHCMTHRRAFPIAASIKALEDSTWLHLEDLGITGMMGSDKNIQPIMNNLPSLRRAQFDISLFGPQCWSGFTNKQGNSLRVLDLRRCNAFESRWTLDALTYFVYLEELCAPSIKIADIKEYPHHWKCLGLKKLDVFFIRDPENSDKDQMAFEFLSYFKRLESIDVSNSGRRESRMVSVENASKLKNPHTLRWRLDAGLGKLARLKNLRRLVLDNRFQDATVGDVLKMVEQWPYFTELMGILSSDPEVRVQMAALLKDQGVVNMDLIELPLNSVSK